MQTPSPHPVFTPLPTLTARPTNPLPSVCLWLLALFLASLPVRVAAQTVWTHTVSGGTVTLTKYLGTAVRVTVPDTYAGLPVTRLGNGVFWNAATVRNVTLPAGLVSIGSQAFGFSGLREITIPAGITVIQDETFRDCLHLTNVTLPEGLRTIAQQAFARCPELATMAIPQTVTTLHGSAFMNCSKLTAITVADANPTFASVDGVLFSKNLATLRAYPAGRPGDYQIPDSVRAIGENAFSGAVNLSTLVIPDAVTLLGSGAFQNCTQLTSLRVGRGITILPHAVFASCLSLREVELPDTLRTISDLAFFQSLALRSIVIPASVRTLGSSVFEPQFFSEEPVGLASIYFEGNRPTAGPQALVLRPYDEGPIVYYRAGTTGWQEEFAGRPTVLWEPRVAAGDEGPGVREGQFRFKVTGSPGISVVVEAADNLQNPAWTALGTFTLTDGAAQFADPDWQQHPGRFYRFRSP